MTVIKVIITRVIKDSIIIHAEISLKVIVSVNQGAEAVAVAEVITTVVLVVGPIIKAILITNYAHDDEYQTDQYSPPCTSCGGYNHSPKHCFKGEHDINDIMEKMNTNNHQSQSSSLYS